MDAKITKKKVKLGSHSKGNKKVVPKITPHPKGSYNPQFVYNVKLNCGTWEDAKVLHIKLIDKFKNIGETELTPEHYQYYMHFINFNR